MQHGEPDRLTKREREVLALISQGLHSREIADALGIAYFTVRKHRSNILYKLRLTSAAQLSAYAIANASLAQPQNRHSRLPGPP